MEIRAFEHVWCVWKPLLCVVFVKSKMMVIRLDKVVYKEAIGA